MSYRPRLPESFRRTLLERAREMRRDVPEAERRLWLRLRCDQLGFRFRRQHRFPPFVVDFYCPSTRLVIELDGDSHGGRGDYDRARTNDLTGRGLREVR